jgi:hypothetical protein
VFCGRGFEHPEEGVAVVGLLGDDADAGEFLGADDGAGTGLVVEVWRVCGSGGRGIGVRWDGELAEVGLDWRSSLVMLLLRLLLLWERMTVWVLSLVFVWGNSRGSLEGIEKSHGLTSQWCAARSWSSLMLLLGRMLGVLSKLLLLLLRLLLLLDCRGCAVTALLAALLEGALIEDGALDLRRQRLWVNEIDRLTGIRGLLRLLMLRQERPCWLRRHLRRTSLLIWVLPGSRLLSMAERKAGWHLLWVHGCLPRVVVVVRVAWLRRLSEDMIERRMRDMTLLLLLLLMLVLLVILVLLLVLCGTVAPGLKDRQKCTALVGLRYLCCL